MFFISGIGFVRKSQNIDAIVENKFLCENKNVSVTATGFEPTTT